MVKLSNQYGISVAGERSSHLALYLSLLDFTLVILSVIISFDIKEMAEAAGKEASYFAIGLLIVLLGVLYVGGMSYAGAYRRIKIKFISHVFMSASALAVSLGVFLSLTFFFSTDEELNRSYVLFFYLFTLGATSLARSILVWWYFFRQGSVNAQKDKVLVVGTGARAVRICELLDKYSEWGIEVIGYLDPDEERVGRVIDGSEVLGGIDSIHDVLKENVVDQVVVAVPRSKINSIGKIFSACEEEGVTIRLMSDMFDFQVDRMRLTIVGGAPLLSFEPVAHDELSLLCKRIFDVVAVLAAMPVLIPLFAILALAVRIDSPGPVFFKQDRVGLRKRIFPMLKFRSMVVDAEAKLKEIEHLNEADGPIFKIAKDPRVTRIGAFMRKTSLDELPQLINVLLGHMTLVGPRPMSIRDVDLFDKGIQRKRFSVRPGLTCLWQISGRSNLPFEKWLELDLAYIDNWSLALDFKILFKTIPVILKGEGAV